MTSTEWAVVIPAAVALVTAVASWIRAQSAHKRIDKMYQ